MPEPDEWLMQQVALGSHRHLETLIRRHARPILTFTTRLLGSTPRGEEALQETFLAVWLRRSTYKYPRFFRPWLFRIAHNKCRAYVRPHELATLGYDADALSADTARATPAFPGPVAVAVAAETGTIVAQALARLPDQQRAILVMHLWNAMSYTEIAVTLEVAEPTVRSAMHYALANLRRYLEPRLRT
jgi:RNA polymerase sigma factor (sigma-70 family)